jgi:hypothetical protein
MRYEIFNVMNRTVFVSKLKRRFSLRLHMTLILLATAMAGLSASKLLLIAGLENPAIRYPLTVLFAYCVFFVAIKFWLWIIVGSVAAQTRISGLSIPDISSVSLPDTASSSASGSASGDVFSGGGGKFSGAGASDSFGEAVSSGSSSGGSSGGGIGSFDIDDDIGIIIVLVLLALLLVAVFGAGVYLVYQAPAILSEVAFDSVLAVSLVRKSKKMQDPDWIGSVFKATWMQFAAILLFAVIAGTAIHLIFPDVTKISELYRLALNIIKSI